MKLRLTPRSRLALEFGDAASRSGRWSGDRAFGIEPRPGMLFADSIQGPLVRSADTLRAYRSGRGVHFEHARQALAAKRCKPGSEAIAVPLPAGALIVPLDPGRQRIVHGQHQAHRRVRHRHRPEGSIVLASLANLHLSPLVPGSRHPCTSIVPATTIDGHHPRIALWHGREPGMSATPRRPRSR